jgi:hypothetical protein
MADKQPEAPDNTAVRVALRRAMHVDIDAAPHVFEDEIGLRLDDTDRPGFRASEKGAKASGTPFISFYTPQEMLALARDTGFKKVITWSTLWSSGPGSSWRWLSLDIRMADNHSLHESALIPCSPPPRTVHLPHRRLLWQHHHEGIGHIVRGR